LPPLRTTIEMDPLPAGAGPRTSRQSPTILLVEDDLATSNALSEFLAGEGFAAVAAADGAEAMDLLRRGFDPVAIVLDLMMPVMDGWDFRQEQLADPALAKIPTIVITAAGFSAASIVTQFGDVEFISKPIQNQALLAAINRGCALARKAVR
jgi:CheY-like chemotaxis protein